MAHIQVWQAITEQMRISTGCIEFERYQEISQVMKRLLDSPWSEARSRFVDGKGLEAEDCA